MKSKKDKKIKIKSWANYVRWGGLEEFLLFTSQKCDLDYKTIKKKKGFIRSTIFFEIYGTCENIKLFFKQLKIIKERNFEFIGEFCWLWRHLPKRTKLLIYKKIKLD